MLGFIPGQPGYLKMPAVLRTYCRFNILSDFRFLFRGHLTGFNQVQNIGKLAFSYIVYAPVPVTFQLVQGAGGGLGFGSRFFLRGITKPGQGFNLAGFFPVGMLLFILLVLLGHHQLTDTAIGRQIHQRIFRRRLVGQLFCLGF